MSPCVGSPPPPSSDYQAAPLRLAIPGNGLNVSPLTIPTWIPRGVATDAIRVLPSGPVQ